MLEGDWEAATKDDVPIDPTTNMPTLPEGMFWNVTEAWDGVVSVNLMQYTGRKFWKPIRVLDYRVSHAHENSVQATALGIVLRRREDAEARDAVKRVIGKYPPNKLNI